MSSPKETLPCCKGAESVPKKPLVQLNVPNEPHILDFITKKQPTHQELPWAHPDNSVKTFRPIQEEHQPTTEDVLTRIETNVLPRYLNEPQDITALLRANYNKSNSWCLGCRDDSPVRGGCCHDSRNRRTALLYNVDSLSAFDHLL